MQRPSRLMFRRLLPLLLLLSLNGCAYLASVSGEVESHVDRWMEQQEYGKALAALEHVKTGHPDYSQLMKKRETILRQATQYERKTVAKTTELAGQGKWTQALELQAQALSRLPDSAVLQDNQRRLLQLQAARLDELGLDLLLARAEGLLRLLPVYNTLASVDPHSWRIQREVKSAHTDAEHVSNELIRLGRTALERKELDKARRSLSLALRLNPSPEAKEVNQELLRRLGPPAPAVIKSANKPSREEETQELLQRYHHAYSNKNWVEAQRLLALLELQSSPPDELPQLRSELNAEVAEVVNRHTEHGIALYSNGKYEQALAAWRKAQQLDPGNERVGAHIVRAERVLDKLRALQEKRDDE
jgi:tetratricopeptide (TPR) repeat protein